MCFKFILGNCNGGEGCNFCHVPAEYLTDEYIDKVTPPLTKLVREGLEKLDGRIKKRKKRKGTIGSVSFDPDINGKDDSDDTPSDPLRRRGWHKYVHPTMRELTKNLRAKGYPILMNKGLEQAGMKLKDLPQLKCKDCSDPPRSGLCFKFLLGNCNGGEDCNFCHITGEQLPEAYINKVAPHLTNLVKNGLEKLDGRKRSGSKKRKGASGQNKVSIQE